MMNVKNKLLRTIKTIMLFFVMCTLLAATAHCAEINIINDSKPEKEVILLKTPKQLHNSWIPLRKASGYLPIKVYWNKIHRNIVICSEVNKTCDEISVDNLGSDLKIIKGTTYCTPQFLASRLLGVSFVYNDMLWYCDTTFNFEGHVKTVMRELQIILPNEYKFITDLLSGGIKVSLRKEDYDDNVFGYVYPYWENPVCYVVNTSLYGNALMGIIAHEAYHVYEFRIGSSTGEFGAEMYAAYVLNLLRQETREPESDLDKLLWRNTMGCFNYIARKNKRIESRVKTAQDIFAVIKQDRWSILSYKWTGRFLHVKNVPWVVPEIYHKDFHSNGYTEWYTCSICSASNGEIYDWTFNMRVANDLVGMLNSRDRMHQEVKFASEEDEIEDFFKHYA